MLPITVNPNTREFQHPGGYGLPAYAVPGEPVTEADIERDPDTNVLWREMQQCCRAEMEKEQKLARSLGFAHAFVDPGLGSVEIYRELMTAAAR